MRAHSLFAELSTLVGGFFLAEIQFLTLLTMVW